MIALKKILFNIVLILLMSALIIGCNSIKSSEEPPNVSISIGDKEINYIVEKNKWNGGVYDREDTFHTILRKSSESDIPYIEIGKTATINFNGKTPSQIKISDILIDKEGNQKYSDKEIINIPVELNDSKCSFEINNHLASVLSLNSEENKTLIRGFRIIASWGENECEYAFIIRTNGV